MSDTGGKNKGRPEPDEAVPTASSSDGSTIPGGRIGKYKILSILGEGGYGMVYLAEQQGLVKRRVALKVIKPGMDTRQVIARFEAERQALALLDHPNIAQVYDAGTTEAGRPYFVMEYVKGVPITEHCDRYKTNIEDRLALFLKICEAVQHAHQKGIIHRDIKPSNVIVAIEGNTAVPKIIDFGVAKALSHFLTERTLVTEHGQMLGTPEYMSPEQAQMTAQDIDTRSDIYSMSVVLYELLTGALPFDPKELREGGMEHIRHVICEQEPKTPSTRLSRLSREESVKLAHHRHADPAALKRRLRGDLDWITLKAMEKDRTRRYASVGEFAADIRRHLNDEPVLAGPPSSIYRFRKFVRRNRAIVAGVMAVAVVLTVGLIVSTVLYFRAERASAKAQMISNFLRDDVLFEAGKVKGRDATAIDLLNAAVEKLDEGRFRDQPLVEAEICSTISSTYFYVGNFETAAQHEKRVYDIFLEQLGEEHERTRSAMNWLAVCYYHGGKYQEAVPLYIRRIKYATREKSPVLDSKLHFVKANLATAYHGLGRYEEAEQLLRAILENTKWESEAEESTGWAQYGHHLGDIYREQGRYDEAETVYRMSLKAKSIRLMPVSNTVRALNGLGRLYMAQGNHDKAEDFFKQGMEIGNSELPGKGHPWTLRNVNGLAVVLTKKKQYEDAETLFNQALAGRKLKLGEDHPETLETINDLGILYREQKHYEQAEKFITDALEARKIKLGPDHPHTLESVHELAILYKEQGLNDKAEPLLHQAVEDRIKKLGRQHPHTQASIQNLIELYEASGKPAEAQKRRAQLTHKEQADE